MAGGGFRRCPACGERNIVKDDWFVCGVCGADLPTVWNFLPDSGDEPSHDNISQAEV
jgi:transcription initiation factor TFIIIB Brf1 subunit/transcription initiation factor TFIIB